MSEFFGMRDLQALLQASASRHSHLCPRQVLGVRAGLAGLQALCLEPNRKDKRLLVIVETDGCFVDGVIAATGAEVGHRTLRIEDYGKVAATFIDTKTGKAYRVAPKLDIREKAWKYAPGERRHYFAQLHSYQVMPTQELFSVVSVNLKIPIEKIISRPGVRVKCSRCGEEIINEREITSTGRVLCQACSGEAYYQDAIEG